MDLCCTNNYYNFYKEKKKLPGEYYTLEYFNFPFEVKSTPLKKDLNKLYDVIN